MKRSSTPYEEISFVAFDFETTGLYPENDRIIEIGALKFVNGKVIDTFEQLVNPQMSIPAAATRINGIFNKDVSDKPVIGEVLPRFSAFINGNVLIAHNARFDISFLDKALSRLGEQSVRNRVLDTCSILRRVFKGRRSYSLQNLAGDFSLEVKNAHRALDDARICMELFLIAVSEKGTSDIKAVINL